ncbi:hypothetical protein QYE76_037065 [Lolium multiflorum]|uniref:Retrotransposon gag domain-containing protein n=1 Tax=Lolium multiflorum TaxID=4521 RepID=A0AAD8R433_LOLMU|nr:hypothetical protein QYE76_037065 [Lolium multiflorum]
MAEEQITYEDLPPDHKKKYDELKAIVEAELIGSFEKTRSHGIRFKGFTPQGVLDGVDLALPSDERTRALRQEVNYMVAHSLHRHSESLVNTLERVALRVVQEIMERRYSPSGPGLTKVATSSDIVTRNCISLLEVMSRSEQQGTRRELGRVQGPLRVRLLSSRELLILSEPYQEETSIARGEEQLDMKTDVKMAVKAGHGAGHEDISWTREGGAEHARERRRSPGRDNKIVNQENKNSADIITWREYEALRNEMRREFRTNDDELKSTVDEIKQTLDATNVTVTGLSDQMTDIQRNIADMRLAIENLTVLQQQQEEDDEDPELEDDAHNARGAPRGHRPRGWVPLGRNGRGQDEEDGLGKPKFSIPKFEGGADVEEYLTWELKIEKLWSLHPHYSEDRKIKLASSEFDGYALRWWDSLVRNLDEDGAQPIRTWRAMKEAMTSRFVPTNYMRNIFDKLTLLRQGVKTVDEYYMEMEMLMQRGRVRSKFP